MRVQTVQASRRPTFEDVVGTVRPRLRASVEAKVSGRIVELPVVPGQTVQAGELLARLDAREIQARRDQALAQRDQAERDLRRFATLVEQSAVTRQEYDAAQARQRVASAAVAEAEAMLAYASVTAPFNGIVTHKLADVGDLAMPGKPLLELEEASGLRFEADVPAALIDRIGLGTTLPVRIDATGGNLAGQVAEIAPTADPNSRTFRIKLDLPAATSLRAGQFGRASIPLPEQPAIWVSRSALAHRGQMDLVFVVTNRAAQLRLVRTGRQSSDEVELVSGLTAGEQVVVGAPGGLLDGQPVAIAP
ncbi:MAG: efflux RND transporter periplasmic adaptor subunit [Verrucomicrobia bacterium]|nr:efflux RND transporter periplasmic adaptor subunit [Verrucomicrobiota bacterium]